MPLLRQRADVNPPASDATRRMPASLVLASYLVLFGLLAVPVLRVAASALPATPNLYDSHLIAWILSWTTHALATDPSRVFDANISHPAPLQLTGSEHLFALQLVFAPLRALGCNAVLATNLTALLIYPLAAFAMERLLRALGFAGAVAWTVGLWFALAPHDSRFNVHVLQYPHVWLPAIALALLRLRSRSDVRSALALSATYGLAIFTSYYSAVLATLTAAIWAVVELCRRGRGRLRFVLLGSLAAAPPVLLLANVMSPYLTRAESSASLLRSYTPTLGTGLVDLLPFATPATAYLSPIAWLEAGLAVLGLAGAVLGGEPARRTLPVAFTSWAVGSFLRRGIPPGIAALLASSPLRSFRYVHRLSVLVFFGRSLLWAAGLETLVRWSSRRWAWVAPAVVGTAVLALLGPRFAGVPMLRVPALLHRTVYDYVGQVWREHGGGALLELPIVGRIPGLEADRPGRDSLEPDAMLASTLHWWPTPAAYTGYHAPHRYVFLRTVARLPDRQAIDDLVDLTHTRWLLLRPAEYWPSPKAHEDFLTTLLQGTPVGRSWDIDGWYLFELTRAPRHVQWFRAIAEGLQEGQTVLGTPLAPLDPSTAHANVELGLAAMTPNGTVRADLVIRNDGSLPWPGVPPPPVPVQLSGGRLDHSPLPLQVLVRARWRQVRVEGVLDPVVAEEWIPLDLDVDPGDTIRRSLRIQVLPELTGPYELEIAVEQFNGARLDAGGTSNRRVVAVRHAQRRPQTVPVGRVFSAAVPSATTPDR
jgi:hypothetical protein